jgi:hypothetical protein
VCANECPAQDYPFTTRKALNEMGTPLNTLVVHHKFCLKLSKLCDALVIAQLRFLRAAFKYVPEGQNASVRKRRLVESRLDDITKVIRRCDSFIGKVGGANRSDQDEHEREIVARFLIQRAVPFVEFCQETIEVIAQGVSPKIKWRDIPVWFPENYKDPGGRRYSCRR